MKARSEPSRFWAFLHRCKIARAHMPFWRVVVEARPQRGLNELNRAPKGVSSAVTAVFVWARTIEEAEALATLAVEDEGLALLTADAVKTPPAARPKREPCVAAIGALAYVMRAGAGGETRAKA